MTFSLEFAILGRTSSTFRCSSFTNDFFLFLFWTSPAVDWDFKAKATDSYRLRFGATETLLLLKVFAYNEFNCGVLRKMSAFAIEIFEIYIILLITFRTRHNVDEWNLSKFLSYQCKFLRNDNQLSLKLNLEKKNQH